MNKSDDAFLPDELLWADGGHASEIVLSTLADGEDRLVPTVVKNHVDRCTVCSTQLGHAALLSLHASRELEVKAEHDRVVVKRPLPRFAIATALVVAVLGLLPHVFDTSSEPSALRRFATIDVPVSARGLEALVRHLNAPGSAFGLFVTYGAALLLVCMGIAVVRLLPKKEVSK